MRVYLLTNSNTQKKFVGVEVADSIDILKKHRSKKLIPELHIDINETTFKIRILSKPKSLRIAEELEQFYINFYDTKDNGYNEQPSSMLG